jgi:hypothetical protein
MNTAEDYLRDMLGLLLDRAREAKSRCHAEKSRSQTQAAGFECGRALAYYEVLSALINRLEPFGLSRRQVGVPDDLDLDRELL